MYDLPVNRESTTDLTVADPRAEAALRWAAERINGPMRGFAPASADASFRRYFRLTTDSGSVIVMDAPVQQEDSRPFVHVAGLMRDAGLRVPEILAVDLEQGFLLLSDLGTATYLDVMTIGNAGEYFARARRALLQWQRATRSGALPDYDAALLDRETALFGDWYLKQHLGVTLTPDERDALARASALLRDRALAQPRVFVHRDYMPRNLMDHGEEPGVLDFQDAVLGPAAYDIVSLYRDAFASWPAELVRDGLCAWHAEAVAAGIVLPARDAFLADADWMGLQRHLKVLGIFARLSLRDGKPKYVADTPRFVRYVMEVAPRYPELRDLVQLFERHVLPAL